MKNLKKIFIISLSLLLLLMCFPIGAIATDVPCQCAALCTEEESDLECAICADGYQNCSYTEPPKCTCASLCTEQETDIACPVCEGDYQLCQFVPPPPPECSCEYLCYNDNIDSECLLCGDQSNNCTATIAICGDLVVKNISNNEDFSYNPDSDILKILAGGLELSMVEGITTTTSTRVEIVGSDINLSINNVNIDMSENSATSILVSESSSAAIILVSESNLKGGKNRAGLENLGMVTIIGEGKLTATGGNSAAGIGGGDFISGGNITISDNATVIATGGHSGAGIGGGDNGSGGNITISGSANVTAIGYLFSAGIGGGLGGSGGNIAISDSANVTATGGSGSAGIGGGDNGSGGSITISDSANVTATGSNGGAGIGGGRGGYGGSIEITSTGEVTASSTGDGKSISTSDFHNGGNLNAIGGVNADTITISAGNSFNTGGNIFYTDSDTKLPSELDSLITTVGKSLEAVEFTVTGVFDIRLVGNIPLIADKFLGEMLSINDAKKLNISGENSAAVSLSVNCFDAANTLRNLSLSAKNEDGISAGVNYETDTLKYLVKEKDVVSSTAINPGAKAYTEIVDTTKIYQANDLITIATILEVKNLTKNGKEVHELNGPASVYFNSPSKVEGAQVAKVNIETGELTYLQTTSEYVNGVFSYSAPTNSNSVYTLVVPANKPTPTVAPTVAPSPTVAPIKNPPTGDSGINPMLWIILGASALVIIVLVLLIIKKKKS